MAYYKSASDDYSYQFDSLYDHPMIQRMCDKALEEAREQNLHILTPFDAIKPEDAFFQAWEEYSTMPKRLRRKADWISLNHFGLTNFALYNCILQYRSNGERIKRNDVIVNEAYAISPQEPIMIPKQDEIVDVAAAVSKYDDLSDRYDDIEDYEEQTGYIMINPGRISCLETLEDRWDAYNMMIRRHQRMADWKTTETLGLTNQQIYMGMKKKFLEGHQDEDEELPIETYCEWVGVKDYAIKTIENADFTNREGHLFLNQIAGGKLYDVFDKFTYGKMIEDVMDLYGDVTVNVPGLEYQPSDIPSMEPQEFIDAGVFPSNIDDHPFDGDLIGDLPINEWFQEYKKLFQIGLETPRYTELNKIRISELHKMYSPSKERNVAWQETVAKLGWNPYVEFTSSNRAANDRMMLVHYATMQRQYRVVDQTDMPINEADLKAVQEKGINPIYIVVIQGRSLISGPISAVTNSKYTHAMMSLDHTLSRCYSYGMEGAVSPAGSFIIENIMDKPKDMIIRVYSIFVSDETYKTIKKNCQWFVDHQKETVYSWMGIIRFFFHLPPKDRDHIMFCSEFVDRMIKLGSIDFTKKKSGMVSPGDIERMATASKKIYTVFKGMVKKFKPETIKAKTRALIGRARRIDEAAINSISNPIYDNVLKPCLEIKELPVRIDVKGDVVVVNPISSGYEADYAASHKLLKSYEKSDNIEGMKNELAKNWAKMLQIEDKLYGAHSVSKKERAALLKVRAKYINDFKTYMTIIQKKEPDFNFTEYYEASPYSNSTYRIRATTIAGILKLLKAFL